MNRLERAAKKAEQKVAGRITEALELPKEVVMNLPLITIIGREDITIENYKGVIEYSEERIRVNTPAGVVKIEGRKLLIKQITSESVGIKGSISKIEFLI